MEEVILTYAPFLDVSPVQKLMSPLHNAVHQVHDACGLPIDQLNFLALFLLSYPLAFLFRFIGNSTLRHIYSAVFGILMVIYMMGNDFYHSLFSATITYILLCLVRNQFGTKLIWIWAFGYMSCSHLYIMYINYLGWNVDFTIVQMIFTLKFCALACNLQDGAFPRKEVSSLAKTKAITSPPNPLEYISYLYYFCTILPGPFFEYKEYIAFIDRSLFGPSKQVPAGSLKAFLFIWARIIVVLTGVFLAFSYHPSYLWKNPALVESLNIFARWGLVMASFPLMRCQYYCGWLMSEAAVVISGFGFNGYYDEAKTKPRWDRVTNISLTGIELGTAMKDLIANWNQGTARFLKHYVYFRVSKRPAKAGENPKLIPGVSAAAGQLIVFVVSALWHGFYPGYYIFFISVFLCNQIEVWISKKITPLVPNDKTVQAIYSVISFFVAMGALNYCAISFIALSFENAYIGLARVYFFGHIAMFILYLVTFILPPPRAPRATTKVD